VGVGPYLPSPRGDGRWLLEVTRFLWSTPLTVGVPGNEAVFVSPGQVPGRLVEEELRVPSQTVVSLHNCPGEAGTRSPCGAFSRIAKIGANPCHD
jgi:hypothetical protein